jgi:hypothetical protein
MFEARETMKTPIEHTEPQKQEKRFSADILKVLRRREKVRQGTGTIILSVFDELNVEISGNMFSSLTHDSLLNKLLALLCLTFRIVILRYGISSFHQPIYLGSMHVGNVSKLADSSPLYASPFTRTSKYSQTLTPLLSI